MSEPHSAEGARGPAAMGRILDAVERAGNRLPDPALLFFALLLAVWALSALLSQLDYDHVDPRSGNPVEVRNLLTGDALTSFFAGMVKTFVGFHPLGVVLLAMLGIGVADHTGFIKAGLRRLLGGVPAKGIVAVHLEADTGARPGLSQDVAVDLRGLLDEPRRQLAGHQPHDGQGQGQT